MSQNEKCDDQIIFRIESNPNFKHDEEEIENDLIIKIINVIRTTKCPICKQEYDYDKDNERRNYLVFCDCNKVIWEKEQEINDNIHELDKMIKKLGKD